MKSSLAAFAKRGRPSTEEQSSSSNKTQSASQPGRTSIGGYFDSRHDGARTPPTARDTTPLLSPSDEEEGFIGPTPLEESAQFQATKSVWWLILLTVSIGGLQIAWSVELSNGSPYLLSLGLSKSLMALVWIAGPLSGTLVQPYVGMLSDNCRLRWGKRKPFMIGGAAATAVSLIALAWTKETVTGLLGLFGAEQNSQGVRVTVIVVAVIWVYILDFAINTVQAAIRAFIVDCAPVQQQEAANAMASRFVGVGNIIGYVAGYVNLPPVLWWLGDTQFKDLCAIASIVLCGTVGLSCLCVRERDPRREGPPARDKPGVLAFFLKIFGSIKRLPPQIKKVCTVQFCAWIGFFPMLFYTSSYIGEIYAEPFLEKNQHMTPEELDRLYEDGTRVGTFALLIFAITSLATNLFLPFFIAPTYDTQPIVGVGHEQGPGEAPGVMKDYEEDEKTWLDYLVIPGLTLRRAWMFAQILFCGAMLCTVFVRTVEVATALIGLVGITWALTLWAPWAIISAEIARRDAAMRARRHQMRDASPGRAESPPSPNGYSDSGDDDSPVETEDESADQAGVILGIHNMAIAAPQIIATVASSIIFRVFQKPRGTPGDHSIAIVMALGGIAVLVSAWFIHLIKEDSAPPPMMDSDEEAVIDDEDLETAEVPRRPGMGRARTKSFEQLPRASLERATLNRHRSFGGAEY